MEQLLCHCTCGTEIGCFIVCCLLHNKLIISSYGVIIQQVAELQKENFGLKLRIYFLENRAKIPLGDNEENLSGMVRVLLTVT